VRYFCLEGEKTAELQMPLLIGGCTLDRLIVSGVIFQRVNVPAYEVRIA